MLLTELSVTVNMLLFYILGNVNSCEVIPGFNFF